MTRGGRAKLWLCIAYPPFRGDSRIQFWPFGFACWHFRLPLKPSWPGMARLWDREAMCGRPKRFQKIRRSWFCTAYLRPIQFIPRLVLSCWVSLLQLAHSALKFCYGGKASTPVPCFASHPALPPLSFAALRLPAEPSAVQRTCLRLPSEKVPSSDKFRQMNV